MLQISSWASAYSVEAWIRLAGPQHQIHWVSLWVVALVEAWTRLVARPQHQIRRVPLQVVAQFVARLVARPQYHRASHFPVEALKVALCVTLRRDSAPVVHLAQVRVELPVAVAKVCLLVPAQ